LVRSLTHVGSRLSGHPSPLAIPAEEDAATGYAGKLAIGVAVHVLKR